MIQRRGMVCYTPTKRRVLKLKLKQLAIIIYKQKYVLLDYFWKLEVTQQKQKSEVVFLYLQQLHVRFTIHFTFHAPLATSYYYYLLLLYLSSITYYLLLITYYCYYYALTIIITYCNGVDPTDGVDEEQYSIYIIYNIQCIFSRLVLTW